VSIHDVSLMAQLLERHADIDVGLPKRLREDTAVRRAQEFLDGNLPENMTLSELATASGLPPFRLLRHFRKPLV
jgi:transcriptional regulator GlxA family with amidase domain